MDLDQALSYYERAEAHGHAKAAELRGRMLDSSLWKEHLELKERYPEKPIESHPVSANTWTSLCSDPSASGPRNHKRSV
jgi:TPR repeat protein